MTHPDTCTRRQFADLAGYKPGYITQLIAAGRIVLTPDGKQVRVAESLAKIAATKDPARQHVADRHAAAREAATAKAVSSGAEQVAPGDTVPAADVTGFYDFQNDKAKEQHFVAKKVEVAYRKEAGELSERSIVLSSYADAGTVLRSGLEAMPAQLPPLLLGRDEASIRSTIADYVEQLLAETARRFAAFSAEARHG